MSPTEARALKPGDRISCLGSDILGTVAHVTGPKDGPASTISIQWDGAGMTHSDPDFMDRYVLFTAVVPISRYCAGEFCTRCGKMAAHKIEEVIFDDDPNPARHPATAYLCDLHFRTVMFRAEWAGAAK